MARFLFLIFFVFSLLSCKKDIDSSNIQVEEKVQTLMYLKWILIVMKM